jgi:hypothetical protein
MKLQIMNYNKAYRKKASQENKRPSSSIVFAYTREYLQYWSKNFPSVDIFGCFNSISSDPFGPMTMNSLSMWYRKFSLESGENPTESFYEVDVSSGSTSSDIISGVLKINPHHTVLSGSESTCTVGCTAKKGQKSTTSVTKVRTLMKNVDVYPYGIRLVNSERYDSVFSNKSAEGRCEGNYYLTGETMICRACSTSFAFDVVNYSKFVLKKKTLQSQNQLLRHRQNLFEEIVHQLTFHKKNFESFLEGIVVDGTNLLQRWRLRFPLTEKNTLYEQIMIYLHVGKNNGQHGQLNQNMCNNIFVMLSELPLGIAHMETTEELTTENIHRKTVEVIANLSENCPMYPAKLCKCPSCSHCLWEVADAFLGTFRGHMWSILKGQIHKNLMLLSITRHLSSMCVLDSYPPVSVLLPKKKKMMVRNSLLKAKQITQTIASKSHHGFVKKNVDELTWDGKPRGLYYICCHAFCIHFFMSVQSQCCSTVSDIQKKVETLAEIWHPKDPILQGEKDAWLQQYVGFHGRIPNIIALVKQCTSAIPLRVPTTGLPVQIISIQKMSGDGRCFHLNNALDCLCAKVECEIALQKIVLRIPLRFLHADKVGMVDVIKQNFSDAWDMLVMNTTSSLSSFIFILNNHFKTTSASVFLPETQSMSIHYQLIEQLCVDGICDSLTVILWFYYGGRLTPEEINVIVKQYLRDDQQLNPKHKNTVKLILQHAPAMYEYVKMTERKIRIPDIAIGSGLIEMSSGSATSSATSGTTSGGKRKKSAKQTMKKKRRV